MPYKNHKPTKHDFELFKSLCSLMFDDLNTFNLAPRHFFFRWIMLNTKNKIKWCFEKNIFCII